MKTEVIDTASEQWAAVLEKVPHDFYHLPKYVSLSARYDGGEPRAVLVHDGDRQLLLPVVLRKIPGTDRDDATAPYGYPGPLVVGPDAARFAASALAAAGAELRTRGWVSLFARLHPVLGTVPSSGPFAVVEHGQTVVIDLTQTPDEMWRETMSGHRNEIHRAQRAGHRVYVDDAFEHAGRFVDIYLATMRRVDASRYYFFDDAYLRDLRETLGDRLHLIVVEIGGAVAAAGLFVRTGHLVQYHLSGVDDVYVRDRPTKLMLHHARLWFRDQGAKLLHLGGGLGGAEDSLFRFKAGFSHRRGTFRTLRMVIDAVAYQELSKQCGTSADRLGGFFPVYRAPV